MTYKDIKHNEEVNELLKKGNRNLGLLGLHRPLAGPLCPGSRNRCAHSEKIRLFGT